jgi:hypothetical protein
MKSNWRKRNLDKWTIGKKIRHVIAVIASLLTVAAMAGVMGYVLLIYFGILGFLLKLRDTILLNIAKDIFGG